MAIILKPTITISNKGIYTFIAIAVLLGISGIVYAYTNGIGGNPAVMGHSIDEIQTCGNNQVLKTNSSGNWQCVNISSLSERCISVGVNNNYKEVTLIKEGKNICDVPYGCTILLYKTKLTLSGLLTGDFTDIYDLDGSTGWLYIQDAEGDYREGISGESSGTNGDATEKMIRDWGSCDIYDDKSSAGITVSKDNLVIRDNVDDAYACAISICSRN